jgi:CrcB protein
MKESRLRYAWEWIGVWGVAMLTNKFVALTLGGAVGTHVRYWVGRWINETGWGRGFPLGTFAVNVGGSFLLGVIAVLILERLPPSQQAWFLLLGTGFCGGLTTFSTFEWETFRLVRDGSLTFALLNVAASVLAGFAAILLAVVLVETLLPRR